MSIYSMRRNVRKRYNALRQLWVPFTQSRISFHSAAACFYILLSLLPATALVFTILSIFPDAVREFGHLTINILPFDFRAVTEYLLDQFPSRSPAALLSVWAFLTLWSASKGIMAMTDGLIVILDCQKPRGFIRRRVDAMIVFAILSVVLIATLVLHVFGRRLLTYFSLKMPDLKNLLLLLFRLRQVYSLLILSILFALLYLFLPQRPLPFLSCLKSGFFSSVGWLTVSYGFSIYVNYFRSDQKLYGSLGLILLTSLWLQICISILLYGALLGKLLLNKSYHPIKIIREALF